jgi:membrane-bound lytic murein transglycosylase D
MPDHSCLRIVAGGLALALVAGGSAFAAGDPYHLSPSEIEQAVAVPLPDGTAPSDPTFDLLVQQAGQESGSEAVAAPLPSLLNAFETDPWAEAFAESARLGAVPPPVPHYPLVINAQVQRFIEHYTGNRREVVGMWLSRSQRYRAMIRDALRAQGLPEELAFVAMIESGYNPLAVSRAGAKGLWQFMAGTARRYGLRVDQWVDERFDPEKSTTAAAAYLRDLHQQFGSWALAKAAYNAGEVKVVRAIKALGTTDFWTLAGSRFLKQETKEFVPAIHAATVIGMDPTRFGFELVSLPPLATEAVTVPGATNLRALALASGLPADAIRDLNPVLVRGVTPPGRTYRLNIPASTTDSVMAALAPKRVPTRRSKAGPAVASADVHVVRANETVGGIAKRYGITVADLVRWNGLDAAGRIRPGDRLRLAELRLTAGSAAASVR